MGDVVITGLAVVSPLGADLDAYWAGLLAGRVPIQPLRYPGSAIDGAPTYVVDDGTQASTVDPAGTGHGRASRFALAAAGGALAHAGLAGAEARAGVGLCVGVGNGDSDLLEADRDGRRPARDLEWYPYGTAGVLAAELGTLGPNLSVATACSAGAYAVGVGADLVAAGAAEVVLVGGAEAVCRPAMGAFLRLGAVDPLHCRPFDADRAGTVYGEGAAFLVLESGAHAQARGQRALARVVASAWSCDAHHATAPDPAGEQAVRAAQEAMARARLTPADLGAVVCHGTGTPANDRMESISLARLLGERVAGVPATALKSVLGHSGGAAGAFSCLTAALIASRGQVPPVPTLHRLDDECRLDVRTETAQLGPARAVLVNAYAFGGNNISVLIAPPTEARAPAPVPAPALTSAGRPGGRP